ncbi:MAG: T9SS type A sorting domain-containing protein [Bacteroidia bacterium]
MSTFEMIGASHAYQLKVLNNNQLEWHFNNIMLPDSGTDYAGSQGYVLYKMKASPNTPIGDSIVNSAAIYFDYNAPIITNDAVTLYLDNVMVEDAIFGKILVYPNPAKDVLHLELDETKLAPFHFEIINLQGKVVYQQALDAATSSLAIPIQHLASGLYAIRLVSEKGNTYFWVVKDEE